jgi:predicted ABC-type transport system involved in lysophospholipase L1 biosynthesis ATPase subunit
MSVVNLQNVSRTYGQRAAEVHTLDNVSVSVDSAARVLGWKIGQ